MGEVIQLAGKIGQDEHIGPREVMVDFFMVVMDMPLEMAIKAADHMLAALERDGFKVVRDGD